MDFDATFSPDWAAGEQSEELQSRLTPHGITSTTGEVLFQNLIPGLYQVRVVIPEDDGADFEFYDESQMTTVPSVPVVAGASRSISVSATYNDQLRVPFQIRHIDTTLLKNVHAEITRINSSTGRGWSSSGKIDLQSLGEMSIDEKGMSRVSVEYVTPLLGKFTHPIQLKQPSYTGERWVAVSQLAPRKTPLVVQTRFNPAAKITVLLEDENGKPVQGVARVDNDRFRADIRLALTDENGRVIFDRLIAGEHRVDALVPGWRTAVATLEADDAFLEGQYAVSSQSVDLSPGDVKTIRLRRQAVAYLRGFVKPIPPADAQLELFVEGAGLNSPLNAIVRWSRESGEFVIGPILPGAHALRLVQDQFAAAVTAGQQKIDVPGPGVHRVDVAYSPQPLTDIRKRLASIRGAVVDVHGDPVYSARLAILSPKSGAEPEALAWSDARGRFAFHDAMSYRVWPASTNEAETKAPVLVAWLPGRFGASMVELPSPTADVPPEEITITLPHAAAIRGRVTVAGDSPRNLPATIQILAKHADSRIPQLAASVWAPVDANGAFEILGLTPGGYEIQASLDNVWASATKSITVLQDGESVQTLDLDIAAPGDVAQYRLLDSSGAPLANQTVVLTSPELSGPIARSLRPAMMMTDNAGILYLEGLTAGEHAIEVESHEAVPRIQVPPVGAPMDTPIDLQVN